jgi:hypothetical protein
MYARRSGKVLALCRLTMAVLFMAGILFSTDIPLRNPALTQVLVGGYVLWATGLATAAWFDWWYDCRLAPTAQFIDFMAFASAIYFTERPQGVLTGRSWCSAPSCCWWRWCVGGREALLPRPPA